MTSGLAIVAHGPVVQSIPVRKNRQAVVDSMGSVVLKATRLVER